MSATRGQKLDESLTYQQFLAKVEEEEAWISEKQQLLSVEDFGDNMAAVQGLLKKHDAFETDFAVHRDRCADICDAGNQLISEGNHHSASVGQRCQQLQVIPIRKNQIANSFNHLIWFNLVDCKNEITIGSFSVL